MSIKLRTELPLESGEPKIDYQSKLLLMGSCFSDLMGTNLMYFQYQSVSNPFGVLFNPVSLAGIVKRAIHKSYFKEDELIQVDGVWKCFDVHSQFSDIEQSRLLKRLNTELDRLHGILLDATHVFLTLGTAWVYERRDSETIVANCHKIPQDEFNKRLLDIDFIQETLEDLLRLIQSINPEVAVIFTVSPVRHLKDGFVANTRSKSRLIEAIHRVREAHTNRHYFPSYEIQMDELRDYRFYDRDLLHPNDLARDYIWEKFQAAWMDDSVHAVQKRVASIQQRLLHRPMYPEQQKHQEFVRKLQQDRLNLVREFPHMHFEEP